MLVRGNWKFAGIEETSSTAIIFALHPALSSSGRNKGKVLALVKVDIFIFLNPFQSHGQFKCLLCQSQNLWNTRCVVNQIMAIAHCANLALLV